MCTIRSIEKRELGKRYDVAICSGSSNRAVYLVINRLDASKVKAAEIATKFRPYRFHK